MKYIIILICIIVYSLFDTSLGYTTTSPWHTHITYIFQHASIWHLTINSISFITIYTALEYCINKNLFLPVSFLSAVIVSFFTKYELPTVGTSSIIYTMIGLYIGITLFHPSIKIGKIQNYILFILTLVISLIISSLTANSNFLNHIYSLLLGITFSLYTPINKSK